MSVKIEYIGHACFKLTFGDWSCVVDPYENGSVPGLKDVQAAAIEVYCSHGHHDHNAAHLVKKVRMLAPAPQIKAVKTFHDDMGGTKRGENLVHVFEGEGVKVAHFGDLGHVLTDEQVKEIGQVDVALIPVGGFYTINAIDAKIVAQQVKAKIIIPMHYRTEKFGFDVIDTLGEIEESETVTFANSHRVTIDKDTKAGVVVLTPLASL